MKPNYALNLTHDGIDLFERSEAGWRTLGALSLDSEDLEGQLTTLRRMAERRAPKGALAKLVIPASQVLYTRVKAPGPSTAQRKRQIRHALDGRTPYSVSDLAFDWSGTGDEVMVAVVAKETLAEAEEFARTHGFAALSFVATPEADQFGGEPWFGPTAMAAQYLGEGERVERDQDPVRVIGTVEAVGETSGHAEMKAEPQDVAAQDEAREAEFAPTDAVHARERAQEDDAPEFDVTEVDALSEDMMANAEPLAPAAHFEAPHLDTENQSDLPASDLASDAPEFNGAPEDGEAAAIEEADPVSKDAVSRDAETVATDATNTDGLAASEDAQDLMQAEAIASDAHDDAPQTDDAAPTADATDEGQPLDGSLSDTPPAAEVETSVEIPAAHADFFAARPDWLPAEPEQPSRSPRSIPASERNKPAPRAPAGLTLDLASQPTAPDSARTKFVDDESVKAQPVDAEPVEIASAPPQSAATAPAMDERPHWLDSASLEGPTAETVPIDAATDAPSMGEATAEATTDDGHGAILNAPAEAVLFSGSTEDTSTSATLTPTAQTADNAAMQAASNLDQPAPSPTDAALAEGPANEGHGRTEPAAPSRRASNLATPQPPMSAAPLGATQAELADTRFSTPPTQPLDEKIRAAVPRITPKPARLDIPAPRVAPFAALPAEAEKTTLSARTASAKAFAKGLAAAAGGLAARLRAKGKTDATPTTAAMPITDAKPQGPTVRSTPPLSNTVKTSALGAVSSTPDAAQSPATPVAKTPLTTEAATKKNAEAGKLAITRMHRAKPPQEGNETTPSAQAAAPVSQAAAPAAPTTDHAAINAQASGAPHPTKAAPLDVAPAMPAPATPHITPHIAAPLGSATAATTEPMADEAPFASDVDLLEPFSNAPDAPMRSLKSRLRPQRDTQDTDNRTTPKANRTAFGGPKSGATATGTKYLMTKLVAVLLLFMGGIAVWDSYLTTETAPQPEVTPVAQTPLAVGDQVAAARGTTGGALPTTSQADARLTPLPNTSYPAATADQTTPEDDTADLAVAPQTPLTQETPPTVAPLADLGAAETAPTPDAATGTAMLSGTSTSTVPPLSDEASALALSNNALNNPALSAAPSFTDVAPIIPTVSGTVTPSGAVIYAGRPAVIPPARPRSVTAAATAAAAAAVFPNADPALSGTRPKARPTSVEQAAAAAPVPPATTPDATAAPAEPAPAPDAAAVTPPEAAPEATLSPEEAALLKALQASRPKSRPAAVGTAAAKADAAAKAEADAAAKAEEEARLNAEAEAQKFAGATSAAVETSRRPNTKPRNIASAVEAAVAAAVANTPREAPAAAPVPAPAPAIVAAAPVPQAAPKPAPRTPTPAPSPTVMSAPKVASAAAVMDELDEPEPTAPTRSGATTRTVANQATEKNALNLGKVNLIGLFGAKGNRRGLVRMPNGSFVRVQVGDRLDGGKVTAIGDGQLSYQKSGRNVTLKLLAGG